MSIRYGVGLIPEPSFTSRVYRLRQLLCGQYASWAAEMHLLHLALADYFQCADAALGAVSAGLSRIAEDSRRRTLRFPMHHRGVSTFPNGEDKIHLDFTVPDNPIERSQRELNVLHREVIDQLEQAEDVVPDLRSAGENYRPHITLMQYANLSPDVFDTALEFARAVLRELQVPNQTRAWQMVLARFESEAAGDNWDNGGWAADLRWQLLASYPL